MCNSRDPFGLCPPKDNDPCSDRKNYVQKGINRANKKTGSETVLNVLAAADATITALGESLSSPGAFAPSAGALGTAETAAPIVIGELMGRVRAAASELGASTLETSATTARHLYKANMSLLRGAMREGREILDIGIDARREVRSPWYRLERELIERRGYPVTNVPHP